MLPADELRQILVLLLGVSMADLNGPGALGRAAPSLMWGP
jgi:hypothetical protein